MIAIDPNILIYAHQNDSPWRAEALAAICPIVEGRRSGFFALSRPEGA